MNSEVYNIDCLEYMRGLPDNAFALAIADPPYGICIDIASMEQGTGVAPDKNSRVKLNKSRLRGGGQIERSSHQQVRCVVGLRTTEKGIFR